MKQEIKTTAQVEELVNKFYAKVNTDPLLSPVFNQQAAVDWESHLPVMYKFWSTQLLGTGNYSGRPFPPHMKLDIDRNHFERWISLFRETVDENFEGDVAETAKQKATNIAVIFQYKLGL